MQKKIYKRTCLYEGCKKEFETSNARKFYCSDACQQKAYRLRRYGKGSSPLKIIKCDNCGQVFKQKRLGQRFCCYKCKIEMYVHERSEYNKQFRERRKQEVEIKIDSINERALAQKRTGVSAGYLEAFKNYPKILTRLIAYQKEKNFNKAAIL